MAGPDGAARKAVDVCAGERGIAFRTGQRGDPRIAYAVNGAAPTLASIPAATG